MLPLGSGWSVFIMAAGSQTSRNRQYSDRILFPIWSALPNCDQLDWSSELQTSAFSALIGCFPSGAMESPNAIRSTRRQKNLMMSQMICLMYCCQDVETVWAAMTRKYLYLTGRLWLYTVLFKSHYAAVHFISVYIRCVLVSPSPTDYRFFTSSRLRSPFDLYTPVWCAMVSPVPRGGAWPTQSLFSFELWPWPPASQDMKWPFQLENVLELF